MTAQIDLWRKFVSTIKTGELPFRLEVRQRNAEVRLTVTLGVIDALDGHDTYAGTSETLPDFPAGSLHPSALLQQAEALVYAVVERVWLHELREHWSVKGERSRDPHRQMKSDGVGDGVEYYLPDIRVGEIGRDGTRIVEVCELPGCWCDGYITEGDNEKAQRLAVTDVTDVHDEQWVKEQRRVAWHESAGDSGDSGTQADHDRLDRTFKDWHLKHYLF